MSGLPWKGNFNLPEKTRPQTKDLKGARDAGVEDGNPSPYYRTPGRHDEVFFKGLDKTAL